MHPLPLRPWFIRPLVLMAVLMINMAGTVQAEEPPARPADSGYTPDGDIQQTAFLPDAGVLAARLEASRAQQIRVTVQVLSLDAETRKAIYGQLGHEKLKTRGTKIAPTATLGGDSASTSGLDSANHVGTTSHVTTCLLDQPATNGVLTQVSQSSKCAVLRTPSFILLDGLRAGYSDISQRPFIVGVENLETGVNPVVQVLEEGTRVQVHATLTRWDGKAVPKIQLHSEIQWHKLTDVTSEPVFGIKAEPTPVQVPTYAVRTATAAEEMLPGQVLWVDPYLKETLAEQDAAADQPRNRSVLSRLTQVGRRNDPNETDSRARYLVFLIQPKVSGPEK